MISTLFLVAQLVTAPGTCVEVYYDVIPRPRQPVRAERRVYKILEEGTSKVLAERMTPVEEIAMGIPLWVKHSIPKQFLQGGTVITCPTDARPVCEKWEPEGTGNCRKAS